MYCLRCGREIPDGELFCQECAKKPLARKEPFETHVRSHPPVPQGVQRSEPAEKKRSRLVLPLVLISLLCLLLGGAAFYFYRQSSVWKASLAIRTSELTQKEAQLTDLQGERDAVQAKLDAANATVRDQENKIADLQKQLSAQQNAAAQTEYDAAAAQKTISDLTDANKVLQTQLDAKEQTLAGVESNLTSMTARYQTAKEKADFLDTYIVFVNNDGTKLYHTYDCPNFVKDNFWAYSRKLAENFGYRPDSACG